MQTIISEKSVARLFRQIFFIPYCHNRWLTPSTKDTLSQHITNNELGHQGEIYLIIENHLPLETAYAQGCRERALYLFATHRVWDTAHNSGVLIYVNLCEHDLEIIADRGIDALTHQDTWQSLCDETLLAFKAGKMQDGLCTLIDKLGTLLKTHYPSDQTPSDELPNRPVYLR